MKTLVDVQPTPEQLVLISNPIPGVQVIRGAAGSGKTTTALLMLRQLSKFWVSRKKRHSIAGNVNILVLTYNRTLRGYIKNLAENQTQNDANLDLTVSTFGKWAKDLLPSSVILNDFEKARKLERLSSSISLPQKSILSEIEYILGRFPPDKISEYLTCRRVGRGISPRVERSLRQQILDNIIIPYSQWKKDINKNDWNDLATKLLGEVVISPYDVIVADETQDLSANQVRSIMHYSANPSSIVFVLDAAQMIYPRGFTWDEAGASVVNSVRLKKNYRNTKEICKFASPFLNGLEMGEDGTLPDFNSCVRNGVLPQVIKGKYSEQVDYVLNFISANIDLANESVAFLHPLGGGWFDYLRNELNKRSLGFVEITREDEWPTGPENIALSTMHSAKGLEFDHVFILGLNDEVTPHEEDTNDNTFDNLRRLLAMAITRAKETVIIGYKDEDASSLVSILDATTFTEVNL